MPIPHLANIAREIGNHGERVELPAKFYLIWLGTNHSFFIRCRVVTLPTEDMGYIRFTWSALA